MTNKIDSQCPSCDCKTADVHAKIFEAHATKDEPKATKTWIVVKCIDNNHQYRLDPKGKNQQWKKFLKQFLIRTFVINNYGPKLITL